MTQTREAIDEQQKQTMTADEMSLEEKYQYLIGMIEGCMPNDEDVVATEKLLDAYINQFKKGQIINFNKWLFDNHSSFEIPDRIVRDYIKWNI